jgi:glutamate synthase (NADPH) GltB3 subunit (EC 1.4.1.13)
MPAKKIIQREMPKVGLHETIIPYEEVVRKVNEKSVIIYGNVQGKRIPSRILEEYIQEAVREGARNLHIYADGQHGIGGRIYPQGEPVKITIERTCWTEMWFNGNVRNRDSCKGWSF